MWGSGKVSLDQMSSVGLSNFNLHASRSVWKDRHLPRVCCVPPESLEHSYLMDFMLLKFLELSLEAQVGVGTGPACTHSVQGIFPAKVSDGHDVRDHQSHTPGDTGQAVGPREWPVGKEGLGSAVYLLIPLEQVLYGPDSRVLLSWIASGQQANMLPGNPSTMDTTRQRT